MKKSIIFIVLMCLGGSMLHAQEVYNSSGKKNYNNSKKHKKKGYDPDKLILGGGLNGGLGSGYINAGVSPIVGYRITDNFAAGVGLGYQYYREPHYYIDPLNPDKPYYSHSYIVYPSVWARHNVYRNFFVEGIFEYDIMTQRNYLDNMGVWNTDKIKLDVPSLLLGAGIRQPLGGRVCFYGEVMHDVLQQPNGPYTGQPLILKFGIAAGF